MNRSFFALFVALLLHIVLALMLWIVLITLPKKELNKPDENRIKLELKEYKPKKDIPIPTQEQVRTQEPIVAPPMPKGSQLKKLTPLDNKKIKYEEKKVEKNEPKLNTQEPKQSLAEQLKQKFEPLPPQKPFIPLRQSKPKDEYSWMNSDLSNQEVKTKQSSSSSGSSVNSDIKELYGDDFSKLSSEQQKYILDNLEIMRRITQEVLNRVADVNLRGTNINKNSINVIEFYLHPNGDMSDFRFIKNSGYYELDRTTKETIEFAYSRYPHPKEKTLIRYNVLYRFY